MVRLTLGENGILVQTSRQFAALVRLNPRVVIDYIMLASVRRSHQGSKRHTSTFDIDTLLVSVEPNV